MYNSPLSALGITVLQIMSEIVVHTENLRKSIFLMLEEKQKAVLQERLWSYRIHI